MEEPKEPLLWKSEPEAESIVSVTLARAIGALFSTRTKRLMEVISCLSPHGQIPRIGNSWRLKIPCHYGCLFTDFCSSGSLEDSLLFLHKYVSDAAEKNDSFDQVLVPMIQNVFALFYVLVHSFVLFTFLFGVLTKLCFLHVILFFF